MNNEQDKIDDFFRLYVDEAKVNKIPNGIDKEIWEHALLEHNKAKSKEVKKPLPFFNKINNYLKENSYKPAYYAAAATVILSISTLYFVMDITYVRKYDTAKEVNLKEKKQYKKVLLTDKPSMGEDVAANDHQDKPIEAEKEVVKSKGKINVVNIQNEYVRNLPKDNIPQGFGIASAPKVDIIFTEQDGNYLSNWEEFAIDKKSMGTYRYIVIKAKTDYTLQIENKTQLSDKELLNQLKPEIDALIKEIKK